MKIKIAIVTLFLLICIPFGYVYAQDISDIENDINKYSKSKRAWEFGAGASIFQFSRVDFTNFTRQDDNYIFDLQLRHNVIGPNLYIARELTPHLYIDVQGNVAFTKQFVGNEEKFKHLYMVGPGLQWRLGEYFESKYIDPFFRVGVNYMKKNFDMKYTGQEGDLPDEMSWILENVNNKYGKDRNSMTPIALGLGLNMWLNDSFGIGLQGDYLLMLYKDVANSLQGTVRLIWRIGGRSKKPTPVVKYVETERVIQAQPTTVEKIVEVPVKDTVFVSAGMCELFENVYFEFDKDIITFESNKTLDKIAEILKSDQSKKYLITGYTDSRGNEFYNIALSRRRAAAIIEALEKRGVPSNMLKSRGVGKKVSYATSESSSKIREGDRKVTVEIITNMEYWNHIPKRDY